MNTTVTNTTMIYPEKGTGGSDEVFSEAQQTFQRATSALNKLVGQLDVGELSNGGEANRLLKELKSALQTALQERERLEQKARSDAGIVNDYAVDFDAARSEIGRRLACLRGAGGA
jgi:hypothetical protein